MAAHQLSASALIQAAPQDIYAIIADYHDGHTRIVPKPPFVSVDVEQGGVGAGTVIKVVIRLLGKNQTYRATVTEPEPGRVLVETNENGYVTSFTVEPREGGKQAYVTIATDMSGKGFLERWLMTRLLRPVYVKELEQLATVAGARTA